ncbi:MAG: hydrolase [Bacillota bacterium]|nr:hydrolase [Bacillota bacterium]
MAGLALDPSRTALVLIDLQKGIVAMPAEPYAGEAVVERAKRLAGRFREVGGTVVLVHVTPSPDGRDALRPLTDAPAPAGFGALPADWADFVPGLGPEPGDLVITKRQWGAFYGTELDLQLRRRGIGTIVLGGISTDRGVESTARDAYERGYQLVFVEDACSARSAEDHRHSMERIFPQIGRVRRTEEVLAALQPS